MRILRFLLLPAAFMTSLVAQDTAFRYQTSDQTKTEKLDYNSIYGVEITTFDFQGPRFHFNRTCQISGLRQDKLTYITEQFSGDLPIKEWEAFQVEVRKLPLEALSKGQEGETSGAVIIDGKSYKISAGPDSEARKKWQGFLDTFVHKNPADWTVGKSSHTVEGEAVKPLDVTVPELLKEPGKFDGKRVRLTAFYHTEEECNHLVASAAAAQDFKNGIWLAGSSSFHDPEDFVCKNDTMLSVEGTFSTQPGARGHMGAYVGSMTLVTSMKPVSLPDEDGK